MTTRLNRLAMNDEGLVFDPATGETFTVNSTGLFILRELKAGKSSEEILTELREQFEATPEEAERDIMDFIAHLKTYQLIS